MGRKTEFTQKIADELCRRIVENEPHERSLRKICQANDMPCITAAMKWLRQQHARAKEHQVEVMEEELLAIADDGRNDTYEDDARVRWKHLHEFQDGLAKLQSVYALTTHTSQGSTYSTVFMDVPDIRRNDNTLEMQQMCYVAATRPSQSLVLVGV